MKKLLLVVCCLFSLHVRAEDPKVLIREINKKFNLVNDYTANIFMRFNVPGVKMSSLQGKVLFKKPNKFKIRAKGIFFLPRQNPMENISAMLVDTNAYTSIISGYEIIKGNNCAIVNIIPLKSDQELILGKLWIDTKRVLILKSQITTRNNGTIETRNEYGAFIQYALPDKISIQIEMKKVKIPKMMSADLNKKSSNKKEDNKIEIGVIDLTFTNYKLNTKLKDQDFQDKE